MASVYSQLGDTESHAVEIEASCQMPSKNDFKFAYLGSETFRNRPKTQGGNSRYCMEVASSLQNSPLVQAPHQPLILTLKFQLELKVS